MNSKEQKIIIESYLAASEDEILLTVGRILVTSGDEAFRAGKDDNEKIKEKAEKYLKEREKELKNLICKKLKLKKRLEQAKFASNYELAILIMEILNDSEILPIPINYMLLAVWLVKKKIIDFCE